MRIEEAEFFRVLAPEVRARTRHRLLEKHFRRREVLFFAGEPADFLWVVREGEVRLYKSSPDGRVTTLEQLGPGEAFGALSALEADRYPASAEATSDGEAWCLPRGTVLSLLESERGLALEVLQIIAGRLAVAHERLRSFAHDSASARLARMLMELAPDGEARVTRRALAEAAGTTVETAIRVLRRFERDGIIRGEVGRLEILDSSALRRVFDEGA